MNVPKDASSAVGERPPSAVALSPTEDSGPAVVGPPKWPANVPPTDHACALLLGELPVPPSLSLVTTGLWGELSPIERKIVHGEYPAPALRDAIGLRWRLSVALDLVPADAADLDKEELNNLLAEADRVLDGLRTVDVSNAPPLAAAVERSREVLARDAVVLSERAVSLMRGPDVPMVSAPAPLMPRKVENSVSRKIVFHAENSPPNQVERRTRWMVAALVVTALATGAFYLPKIFYTPPPVPTIAGAPDHLAVVSMPDKGVLLVRTTDSKAPNPEQLAWIEKQRKDKGMHVKEIARGSYMLTASGTGEQQKKGPGL